MDILLVFYFHICYYGLFEHLFLSTKEFLVPFPLSVPTPLSPGISLLPIWLLQVHSIIVELAALRVSGVLAYESHLFIGLSSQAEILVLLKLYVTELLLF